MSPVNICRSPDYFSFVCKRGQHQRVAHLLRGLGMTPSMKSGRYLRGAYGSDGVLVYAKLNGLSKRSIDIHLYEHFVPGARRG